LDNSQIENSIGQIRKRNGSVDPFYKEKISNAIFKALAATSEPDRNLADDLAEGVVTRLVEHGFSASRPPSVEDIQDLVESTLIEKGHSEIAKGKNQMNITYVAKFFSLRSNFGSIILTTLL